MAIRDLIPWNRPRNVTVGRSEGQNPFLALHREVNQLFDDFFRGFDLSPIDTAGRFFDWSVGWPNVEVSETDNEVKVAAELPGLEEKDVEVQLAGGVLAIRGEKKMETEDKDRRFSERYYGRFERRIPVEGVDEEKVTASFKNGVLTVALPKSAAARENIKRIPISNK